MCLHGLSTDADEIPGSPPAVAFINDTTSTKDSDNDVSSAPTPNMPTPGTSTPAESDSSDIAISDLDSDLEEEQLVPTYLKIRGRLFEIDPDIVEVKSRKQMKMTKGRNVKPHPLAVRKLLSQLHQVESDALFDRDNAEAQWPAKRSQIAQTKAASRQQASTEDQPEEKHEKSSVAHIALKGHEEETAPQDSDTIFGDDDSGLLADMFSAIPDQVVSGDAVNVDATSDSIVLRDFGKQSGLAPRRLLEEAVRARLVHYLVTH